MCEIGKKNQDFSSTIVKYESKLHEANTQLNSAQDQYRRAQAEANTLRAQLDITRDSETRLNKEINELVQAKIRYVLLLYITGFFLCFCAFVCVLWKLFIFSFVDMYM
jgi:regulator of replication initiation timing